jgi:hypothetical protein
VVILAGLVIPPAGIALAWLKPDWSRTTKWVSTVLMGLLLVGRVGGTKRESVEDSIAQQKHGDEVAVSRPQESATSPASAASSKDSVPKPLSKGWTESMPTYIHRVITSTVSREYEPVSRLDLTEHKNGSKLTSMSGRAYYEGQRGIDVAVIVDGSDFGWATHRYRDWSLDENARFWDSRGKPLPEAEFCKRFNGGHTAEERRVNVNARGEREEKRNVEAFRKAAEGR